MVDLERLQTLAEEARRDGGVAWLADVEVREFRAACDPETVLALVRIARAAEHVLANGQLGKRSERRLREALKALGGTAAVPGSGGEQR